ncbi:MAG: phospho-N-acetylmuramoyl-pentapeptide-transferase, partial [Pseudonocardiales bacterium]|nr:phospho-N-acetylmuramoyl-pentapeptide-transferase [Pseudonocardiales bacterium]
MGGVAIMGSTIVGYVAAHLAGSLRHDSGPTASGLLLLFLMLGSGGVGFLDDFIKLRRRRSLGLRARAKFLGQLLVALVFGIGAMMFSNSRGLTPASKHLSYVRDIAPVSIGVIGFLVLAYLIVTATTNAVNLTDGMDGLVAGSAAMVMGAYTLITFIQFKNVCGGRNPAGCYVVRDPQDLALIAAAAMGACFGFLWWNASPAQIF